MTEDSMPQKLRKMHEDLIDIGCFGIDLIKEAADVIERLTKPLTLERAAEILTENLHMDVKWESDDGGHVIDEHGDYVFFEFEAKALARAYEAHKEGGFG